MALESWKYDITGFSLDKKVNLNKDVDLIKLLKTHSVLRITHAFCPLDPLRLSARARNIALVEKILAEKNTSAGVLKPEEARDFLDLLGITYIDYQEQKDTASSTSQEILSAHVVDKTSFHVADIYGGQIPYFLRERVDRIIQEELPKPYSWVYKQGSLFVALDNVFTLGKERVWKDDFEKILEKYEFQMEPMFVQSGTQEKYLLSYDPRNKTYICPLAVKGVHEKEWKFMGLRLSDGRMFTMEFSENGLLKKKVGYIHIGQKSHQ